MLLMKLPESGKFFVHSRINNFVWAAFQDIWYLLKKNVKKSRKLPKILWLLPKLVISLNLGYLVTSMAPENHKNQKLICLFFYYFLLLNFKNKNNAFFQAHKFAMFELSYLEWNIFQLPSTSRNQRQAWTSEKTGPSTVGPTWISKVI